MKNFGQGQRRGFGRNQGGGRGQGYNRQVDEEIKTTKKETAPSSNTARADFGQQGRGMGQGRGYGRRAGLCRFENSNR